MNIECAFEVVPVRWGGLDFFQFPVTLTIG